MTTLENAGCLRYVEIIDVLKILVTKLKAMASKPSGHKRQIKKKGV